MKLKPSPYANVVAVLCNLALAYIIYMITRVAFVAENWHLLSSGWSELRMDEVLVGSLRFDSSAIFYTHSLWIVLMLLPLHLKERAWWQTMCKWIYVVVNALAVVLNLSDAVYSQYSGRRTTASFFAEFGNEDNMGGILLTELAGHWYLVLLGAALIALMWWMYTSVQWPVVSGQLADAETNSLTTDHRPLTTDHQPLATDHWPLTTKHYYLVQSLALLVAIPMAVFAMRGGFTRDTRPITVSNAGQYVHSPQQASIVLNTPFSIIRTIGKQAFSHPHYMADEEATALFSPIHTPQGAELTPLVSGRRNVVVLIMESFSKEYIGHYNAHRPLATDYRPLATYTPFLDSLLAHSLTWRHTFANGRKSIDAMPSTLSSLPYFVEPFILTPSSLNDLSGLADCLGTEGYQTAFFHGAPNSSMGFQAFARSTGFRQYFGLSEYCADKRFHGRDDFDGHCAIWDEEFMQFMALALGEQMEEPFVAGFFSASSHHPFVVPQRYEGRFPQGTLPIHVTIGYSDNALRRFFATARRQPWFENTLFVITADHTNQLERPESLTALGLFEIPIAIYDPRGELPTGMRDGVAQQIDVMPTLLRALGYPKPYFAFGKDLFDSDEAPWAVNYSNGIYQYVEGDYVLQFDGSRATALYRHAADPLLHTDLLADEPDRAARMERRLKALVQSYMVRMIENRLRVDSDER